MIIKYKDDIVITKKVTSITVFVKKIQFYKIDDCIGEFSFTSNETAIYVHQKIYNAYENGHLDLNIARYIDEDGNIINELK